MSTVHKWVKICRDSKSFKEVDQLTEEQKEIKKLKKELKDKNMELDILKQAALIIEQKH
ncbi:MAG: hypothetical protein ACK5HR_03980 [Mycoplasmatales bacterium]